MCRISNPKCYKLFVFVTYETIVISVGRSLKLNIHHMYLLIAAMEVIVYCEMGLFVDRSIGSNCSMCVPVDGGLGKTVP